MNTFWEIIYANWTWTEMIQLRALADSFAAADRSRP